MANGAQVADGQDDAVIVLRDDGVWFRTGVAPVDRQAAVGHVFLSGSRFAGLDYAVFLRMLFDAGPELPAPLLDQPLVRFADEVVTFVAARRALYKSVKIVAGEADYFFEPVFLDTGAAEPEPATLDFDEFVADMWIKGIRFGIDAAAVREAIGATRPARRVVARRLDPVPGQDAAIAEVSEQIHRSNAPRELANGRLDLHTFQNRFPQVLARVRLLKKVPRTAGTRGFELSGIPIEPAVAKDIELTGVAGTGTVIEHLDGDDYLVAAVTGFINVDAKSRRISIGPKIISKEGVSVRTTGNLQLTGEYEEFGEVQENRVVEGGNITIHGDVFGKIVSRGGTISLRHNLMGGTAMNADGGIRIGGTAANAVLQTKHGEIAILFAQSCVITGTRVTIEEAANCEIVADEVVIGTASGCAIAARRIAIGSAGPRKQSEMLLFALMPDTSRLDTVIADHAARAVAAGATSARHKAAVDDITGQQDVRSYLALATRVRKREVTLTPEQLPRFQKMAVQVGPALKEVARLSLAAREALAQQAIMEEQAAALRMQRGEVAGIATCKVSLLAGDTILRRMTFQPDHGAPYDLPAKDVRPRLRAGSWSHAPLFAGSEGMLDWSSATDG